MKTPMQELINSLKDLGIYTTTLKDLCEYGLEKERQMVIDAYDSGFSDAMNNDSKSEVNYFELTYNNK